MQPTADVAYENPYCTVRWIAEGQYLSIEWRGAPTAEPFHAAHEAALQVLQRHRGSRVLFDTRALKVVQGSDQAWFTADFMPRFVAVGIKRSAVLEAASPIGALSMANIVNTDTQRGLKREARTFGSLDAAVSWLTSEE